MGQNKCFIKVSDPWNFESPDGENIIKGSILSQRSVQCIVFRSNYCMQFDGVKGFVLILIPRHCGHDFSKLHDEIIAFNGSILFREYSEQLSENELRKDSKFVIIGSLRIEHS